MENIKIHVVIRISFASDSHYELFKHQIISALYDCLALFSIHLVILLIYIVLFCVLDLECKVELLSVNVCEPVCCFSRRHLKSFGLQMNVGAAVTTSNSQAWSAREKSGANAELLSKMKLSQMFFISDFLILKFYSMYKTELIVLIHLLNKEKAFRGCSGLNKH